jgi:hypothetical protein
VCSGWLSLCPYRAGALTSRLTPPPALVGLSTGEAQVGVLDARGVLPVQGNVLVSRACVWERCRERRAPLLVVGQARISRSQNHPHGSLLA